MQLHSSVPLGDNTPSPSMIEQLFGCEVKTHTCCQCGLKTERTSTELLFSLCYPHTAGECWAMVNLCMYNMYMYMKVNGLTRVNVIGCHAYAVVQQTLNITVNVLEMLM